MDCQKNIKNFDLNQSPYASVGEDTNDLAQD